MGSLSTLKADDWDQKTVFTINQPVTIPGHVILPAGTYVIKRISAINPVLQILNESETTVYATVLTVPDFVDKPSDQPEFTFRETPEGSAAIMRSFRYPGHQIAFEFPDPDSKTE
jgi:hypothetical protein